MVEQDSIDGTNTMNLHAGPACLRGNKTCYRRIQEIDPWQQVFNVVQNHFINVFTGSSHNPANSDLAKQPS